MPAELIKTSKFLSLVLRHKPEEIGLALDANGWADVDELIRLANQHGRHLTRPLVDQVVAENDKQRFALSEDGQRIRASQGHSIEVDLALPASQPPDLLYHGTASSFIDSIRATGLHSANRQHVHLSLDVATATKVGQRHGKPVVLIIRAGQMSAAGHQFYLSANGVWLTEQVPIEFIDFAHTKNMDKPLQYGLKSIFGLTTRVAIAMAIATTFGGALIVILSNVFFAMVLLSALVGVLLTPYAAWLVIQRARHLFW